VSPHGSACDPSARLAAGPGVEVWACEAVVTHGVVLGYLDDAAVFGAVAVLLFVLLGRRGAPARRRRVWLLPALAAGVACMLALHAPL
jgi:hypothetical protein